MATPIQHPPTSVETPFTEQETRALEDVRTRFRLDHDILSARERLNLSFLRWLVRSGRLVP